MQSSGPVSSRGLRLGCRGRRRARRTADRLAGRKPVPLLPRCRRYRSAPRHLGEPAPEAERATPSSRPSACWRAPSRRRWSATMFDKTCWDPRRNRYACRERSDYLNPKSHTVLRAGWEGLEDAQTVDCTWLTAPQGRGGPRQGRDAALRYAGAARRALSRRRLDQGGDRRPPGGGDGRARHRSLRRRHGRQLRLRRGQPGRAGALLARPQHRLRHRLQQNAALRLSRPHRRLEGDRRQEVHRGERALAGPGLPPLALFAPAPRGAAARHRGPAPRRDVRRRRLLGRGDHVRPVPASTRATNGYRTRPTCRRSRRSPRRSAAARARATTTCPRPTTSTARSPS